MRRGAAASEALAQEGRMNWRLRAIVAVVLGLGVILAFMLLHHFSLRTRRRSMNQLIMKQSFPLNPPSINEGTSQPKAESVQIISRHAYPPPLASSEMPEMYKTE